MSRKLIARFTSDEQRATSDDKMKELYTDFVPPVDIYETDDGIFFQGEFPGMNKNSISLSIKDDTIIIRGEKGSRIAKTGKFYRAERPCGYFFRRFKIAHKLPPNKHTMNYKDGVLSIFIPRKKRL